MRRTLLLACALSAQAILYFALAPPALGATPLPSTTYNTDTTWTAAGSPYILNGTVTVDTGATLTLEPGVVVKFNGAFRSMNVRGRIVAVGTPLAGILFTSAQDDAADAGGDTNGDGTATAPAPGQWYNIWLQAGGSVFERVEIRYGAYGSGATYGYGAVNITAGTSTFTKVHVHDNQYSGIRVYQASGPPAVAEIKESMIAKNGTGLAALNAALQVTGSHVVDNKDDGLFFNLTSTYTGAASAIVNNEIVRNGRWGVRLQTDPALAVSSFPFGHRNNILANNATNSYNQPNQLSLLTGGRADANWENNYWGVDVRGPVKAIYCPASPAPRTPWHLVYGDDPSLTDLVVPPGPITSRTYLLGTPDGKIAAYCGSDDVDAYPFSESPFRIPIFGFTPMSAADEREAAITDYRPYLFFDEAEHWQPILVDWFLNEWDPQLLPAVVPFHQACRGDACWRASTTDDLTTADRVDVGQVGDDPPGGWPSPRVLEGGVCAGTGFLDCTGEPYAGMYYNRTVVDATVSGEGLRSYWDYWWFYRYNDFTGLPWGFDHEGDWEGMTVVTEAEQPTDSGPPPVLWVAYAQHERVFRYDPGVITWSGMHANGYPADGTHATYAHTCSTDFFHWCNNYAHDGSPDGDHGGERSSALNTSCGSCVQPFPETEDAVNDPTVWPAEGKAGWNALSLKWGGADTPGTQGRYLNPWSAEPGPTFARRALASRVVSRATIDEADCDSWFGPDIVALVCDEGQMQRALDFNTFGRTNGSFAVHTAAGAKVGTTAGLAQVLGRRPLRDGDTLRFVGAVPKSAEIHLRIATGPKQVAFAHFVRPAIGGGKQLLVRVSDGGGRPIVRLVRPDGRVLRPASLTVGPA